LPDWRPRRAGARDAIATEALQAYLDVQAWQLDEIRKGLAEAAAGDFASPEEVEAMFRKYR
jgi:predicted transcriptional regulator